MAYGLAWSDFEGDSGSAELPLLLSVRSQSLLLAFIHRFQFMSAWTDDIAEWDDIEAQLAETIHELLTGYEPVADNTPVGTIVAFIGLIADIPEKWLPCNFSLYAQADYPDLAAILKSTFISGSNFRTPQMSGHYIRGAIDDSDHSGESGSNSHTLTVAELPAHTHETVRSALVGTGTTTLAAGNPANNFGINSTAVQSTGSATAFSVEPLHYRFHWIIKALP